MKDSISPFTFYIHMKKSAEQRGFKRITILTLLSLIINIFVVAYLVRPSPVNALQPYEAGMLLYRMGASRAASSTDPVLIVIKPQSSTTEGKMKISFASGFSIGATVVISTVGLPGTFNQEVLTTIPIGSNSLGTVSVTDVTFTVTDLANTVSLFGALITSGITNPSAAGSVSLYTSTIQTQTAAGAAMDSARVSSQVTSASGDQVTVTASVPPTFSFTLASNTIALGSLTTTAPSTGNVAVSISTNAPNGWVAWLRGANQGSVTNASLLSAVASDSISSNGTLNAGSCSAFSAGTTFYQVTSSITTAGTGTSGSEVAGYNCNGTTTGGTIGKGSYAEVARSSGANAGGVLTLIAQGAMGTLSKASDDYTDTWDVVGAGNF